VLHSLAASRPALYLLGHRASTLRNLPGQTLSEDVHALLNRLVPEPATGPVHRLPDDDAEASIDALRSGDLHVRRSVLDPATGLTRVESTFLGRPLLLTSVAHATVAIQSGPVAAPLQIHSTCLSNPEAGLRQPEARWVRAIRTWAGDRVAITWSGNSSSLCVMAGPDALSHLAAHLQR